MNGALEIKVGDGEGAYIRTFRYDELTINESGEMLTLVAKLAPVESAVVVEERGC